MPPIRVLLVDDMPQVRQDLRTVLPLAASASGLQIEIVGEAQDGEEAVQQAARLQPDVVLMDLAMPVLDGFAATRRIKQDCPSIRVYILTVKDRSTTGQQAVRAGADGFIEKGVSVSEILRAVAAAG